LIKLGIPQQEIDELKEATLSPEEERYIEKLKEWKESEDELLSKLSDLERGVLTVENELRRIVGNAVPLQVDGLAKFDFTGKINDLSKKFQNGTRQWLFDRLSTWFDDEESRVMILTAGPGVGKSVLSAKVCELYKQRGQLAAYHFCDFRNPDSRDPHRILQSLASQMCDNVHGFRDKLTEGLRREHSLDSQSDAFRVLLNNPLHAVETRKPRLRMPWKKAQHKLKLIIVDALDESKTDTKSEFLELISEKFRELPEWIKIFITSRPELQVRKKLQHLNPVEILPDDLNHTLDLEYFILHYLPDLGEGNVDFLISKCEGSFLYAYYLVDELNEMNLGIEPNLSDYVPKGISGFYEKQFKRLRTGLRSIKPSTWSSILKRFVNVIAASRSPLPMKILVECMGVSSEEFEIREAIIGIMSEVLPVYEGCLTVYHKSLWDWLILDGYEEHAFVADVADGNKRLWRACKSVYSDINSLSSVSDLQMSPETKYALENGGNLLLNVADTEDFHWLVNVRVNYLKLKFCDSLNADFSRILGICRSKLSDPIFWAIIQLHAILRSFPLSYSLERIKKCYIYLQCLVDGHFDVLQMNNKYENEARNILDKTNEPWVEEVRNERNLKFKMISHAVYDIPYLHSDIHLAALSPDNKLFACSTSKHLGVFNLPTLTIIFQLNVSGRSYLCKFLIFSPDSSYLLLNSIRTCISIVDQKQIRFIPHGPEDIRCCSFSSCGTRLVTFEEDRIEVWDVRTKVLLVVVENEIKAKYCRFSKCNSYVLAATSCSLFPVDEFALLDSRTLASLKASDICADTCLTYKDNYQIISPCHNDRFSTSIRIDHFHFPTAETLLVANRHCSKPFNWKNKKCVILSKCPRSASPLVVYDFMNKEIIDEFHVNSFPNHSQIVYI
jgi:WD40 repeat protein